MQKLLRSEFTDDKNRNSHLRAIGGTRGGRGEAPPARRGQRGTVRETDAEDSVYFEICNAMSETRDTLRSTCDFYVRARASPL